MMQKHSLCLAWNWKYDADFIGILEHSLHERGLSFLQVTLENVNAFIDEYLSEPAPFRVFWNRTYGSEQEFKPLVHWAGANDVYCINSHDKTILACDKSIMHYILINAGIYTPYTIILPSYQDQPVLSPPDLKPLKTNFIIKPANGGGGEGVVMPANSIEEILKARQEFPADRYLVQALIDPVNMDGHPAWFRVIYCTGKIYPCWWHPHTHIYTPVRAEEEKRFQLDTLKNITHTIAHLTNLDFFSTEIAVTQDQHFIVIDYVNDEIDVRIQTNAQDGVPDAIIRDITERITMLVASYSQDK